MTSPDPTREPEPADDLVEWLNEMRIYEENSEETTEAFTRTIARISADAETIQALREEKARLYVSLELMCRKAERAEAERDAAIKALRQSNLLRLAALAGAKP